MYISAINPAAVRLQNWRGRLVLYVFNRISDFLFLLVARLFRYRESIIRANLKASFPGISRREQHQLTEKYYRHICDLLVEPLIVNSVSLSCLNRLICFENLGMLRQLFRQGRNVVLMVSHYGNWEYLFTLPMFTDHEVIAAYSPLSSSFWDKKMKRIRTRFGLTVIPKAELYKTVLKRQSGNPALYILICDQRPQAPAKHFVQFLNQHTAVQAGPGRIAQKTESAVVYLDARKESRNSYAYRFRLISENGSKENNNGILEKYYSELEKSIRRRPELWLWSHRRWKHVQE